MLSSSKGEAKQEARFAARLDVLMERMDTLAATVATTASAIAKKDGEIAALRRDLEARDQTLQSLAAQTRQSAPAPSPPPVDANELRSLRNAVAGLKERVENGSAAQVEDLTAGMHALRQRVEELATRTAGTSQDDELASSTSLRFESLEAEVAELKPPPRAEATGARAPLRGARRDARDAAFSGRGNRRLRTSVSEEASSTASRRPTRRWPR